MKTTTAILAAANTPVLAILSLAGFVWLAHMSQEQGYTSVQRAAMNRLVERVTHPKHRPVASAQRQGIMEAWSLSEGDVTAPVVLFK